MAHAGPSHSGLGLSPGLAPQAGASAVPSTAGSPDGSREHLLAGAAGQAGAPHGLGDSVPETVPAEHQYVLAENPRHAKDVPLVKFRPRRAYGKDDQKNDLTFWPIILTMTMTWLLVLLYFLTAAGIGLLLWRSSYHPNHQFSLSSENVHMIARYFPSIVGTVTVLLFQQTVREFLRMTPYVNMADQNGQENKGVDPWKSVSGAWFPWQNITTAPGGTAFLSLLCQFVSSFIVSFKVALLASVPNKHNHGWTLSVRTYPAIILIAGYVLMIFYTLFVAFHFRKKSTGLKWDPVSIADYASLFAHCNALKYFAPLELRHESRAKDVMSSDQGFRLGYWEKVTDDLHPDAEGDIVYGIGVNWEARRDTGRSSVLERDPIGRPWYHALIGKKPGPKPTSMDEHYKEKCSYGQWPKCEHYPYRHNPGCARWVLWSFWLAPTAGLGVCIWLLAIGIPQNGYSLPNNLKFPSSIGVIVGNKPHDLPPLDPADPRSTLLVWALIFRSAPTYLAGLFTGTIIEWIDLNMRFMQPFVNMFGHTSREGEVRDPAEASDSVLLAYITLSPLQVPLTAWDNQHWKVCIYSTLNTLSPLFPIFVGGLITVTGDEKRVNLSFSLSAYIGIMVSLGLFWILLPLATPRSRRLLPRQFYSLADLMAMCHESRFLASPHLNIANRDHTPTKKLMEARIMLEGDRFLFGEYEGRDGELHIGFDVAQKRGPDFGELEEPSGSVMAIKPVGVGQKLREVTEKVIQRGKSKKLDKGKGKAVNQGLFGQRARDVHQQGDGELYEMSGGNQENTASMARSSGADRRQVREGGRERTVRITEPERSP